MVKINAQDCIKSEGKESIEKLEWCTKFNNNTHAFKVALKKIIQLIFILTYANAQRCAHTAVQFLSEVSFGFF